MMEVLSTKYEHNVTPPKHYLSEVRSNPVCNQFANEFTFLAWSIGDAIFKNRDALALPIASLNVIAEKL